MVYIVAVLVFVITLVGEPVETVAEPVIQLVGLQIDADLGSIERDLAAVTTGPSHAGLSDDNVDRFTVEPSAHAEINGDDGRDGVQSDLAYPVTSSITLGFVYQVEEIEDLTAELIEMGTVGVDYTSYKVLVRAHWAFDFAP
ncbi:MAG: hypothetical protein ACR2QJ_03505 [Geminicoccaceae bacterium]